MAPTSFYTVRAPSELVRGLDDRIEAPGGGGRLVLQIEMLGRATSLEIDAFLLEPVGGRWS
ncbi:MAG: hypothetical protein ACYTGG_11925 [Planctomycetota bacterium]|jgi:hypothetical protein